MRAEKLERGFMLHAAKDSLAERASQDEIRKLSGIAKKHSSKRLVFFNNADGQKLHLDAFRDTHDMTIEGSSLKCALSGNNPPRACTAGDAEPNTPQGHRFECKCVQCHVYLCISQHAGQRRSRWKALHKSQTLTARKVSATSRSTERGASSGEEAPSRSGAQQGSMQGSSSASTSRSRHRRGAQCSGS